MHPGHIEGATRVLSPPRDWDKLEHGVCSSIPVRDIDTTAGNAMVSAWFPTIEELARLVAGGPVYLEIIGDVHPPVFIGVGKPPPDEGAIAKGLKQIIERGS